MRFDIQVKYHSKIERYDTKRLFEATLKCSKLAGDQAIGLTKADYLKFFQDSWLPLLDIFETLQKWIFGTKLGKIGAQLHGCARHV